MNINSDRMKELRQMFQIFMIILFSFFIEYSVFAQSRYVVKGKASFYADKFEGRKTANGEIYVHSKLTAAHRDLPFGTLLKVTNLNNNLSVEVRVNDRGPFVEDRIIDLSKSAAIQIGAVDHGVVNVLVEQLDKQEYKGSVMPHVTNLYYLVDVSTKALNGYGVQVGSFNQMENLIRLSEKVKSKISGGIYIRVVEINGQTVNRLIVGVEARREEADKHQKILKMIFPDCFVISL